MNKRHALFLTAVLGMATAQAQTAPTTTTVNTVQTAYRDPSLTSAPITANVGKYVGPLSTFLASIAKAAGYEVVFNFNVDALALINGEIVYGSGSAPVTTSYATPLGRPQEIAAKPVVHNFSNAPFNEAWPLLMDVYEMNYQLVSVGDKKFIRISQKPKQLSLPLKHISAAKALESVEKFFGVEKFEVITQVDRDGKTSQITRPTGVYGLPDGIKVIADSENNRLIIGSNNEDGEKIRSFVGTIDLPAPQKLAMPPVVENTTEVYSIKGNKEGVLRILQERFPTVKANEYSSGLLILDGPKETVVRALSLLGQLDVPVVINGPQIIQRVFQLTNASAEEVKATLEGTSAFEATESTTITTPVAQKVSSLTVPVPAQAGAITGTAPASATSDNDPTAFKVIADKRTNTLIVRGTAEQVAQVAELIPQLDQVVPQINVQVRIQEVNERALQSLGLNWRATFGGFNVAVTGGTGLAATFNPTQSFLGFNIFPTLTALETQGLTRRVYDGNVTMQSGQRSLSATGGAQNASSSAAASVKSGGRLEINVSSAAGNIVRQIDYGLNLDFFSPQVAPDGTITLRIRGQVNQPATPITADSLPNLIDFTNSEAQSTITFRNGQTVLMSGLLGSTETSSSSGVPFLSSLPGIGAAFGEKRNEKTQSQLLVIITGTVVK